MKFFIGEKCYNIMPNYPSDEIIDYGVLNELCYRIYNQPIHLFDENSFKERLKQILRIHQDTILNEIFLKNQYYDILVLYLHIGLEILVKENIYSIIEYVLKQEHQIFQDCYLEILSLDIFFSDSILYCIKKKVKETSRSRVLFLLRKYLPESIRLNFYNSYTIFNLECDIKTIKIIIGNLQGSQYEDYIFSNDNKIVSYIRLLLQLQDLLIEKMNIVLETLEKEVNEISGCVTKIKNIKR